MKNTLLRSLLIGASVIAPVAAIAGGVDVNPCCAPPRVDIPEMREGWGLSVEGSALRGYNNNLNYFTATGEFVETLDGVTTDFLNGVYKQINPVYAFGLRVGVDYTLADSANVLKLSYEHLFDRSASNDTTVEFPYLYDGAESSVSAAARGEVHQKLDGVTLVSEQHLLIGPYWETTLTGGARFAHVSQQLNTAFDVVELANVAPPNLLVEELGFSSASQYSMQFNGVGPLAGFGTIFHVTDMLALGAEAQGALLMGRNKISAQAASYNAITHAFSAETSNIDRVYSIVPEMYYRIYGNYFYRFNDGSELEVEAGWRANQFFNLRTFQNDAFEGIAAYTDVNTSQSDDIGFSGPYLMLHYKI